MIIDLAMSAGRLVRQIRNQFAAGGLLVCEEFGGLLAGLVFDHVEFETPTLSRVSSKKIPIRLANGSEKNIHGHRIRIAVDTHVVFASRDALIEGGVSGASQVTRLDLTMTFDLQGALDTDADGVVTARTEFTFVRVDPQPPDPTLRDVVNARLVAMAEGLSGPVDVADLEATLDRAVSVRNFGIALDSAGTRVVTRLEVETTSSDPVHSWESFYESPPDRRDGRDFALFLDQQLLVLLAEERFAEGLREQDNLLKVIEGPVGVWRSVPPGLSLYAYVHAVDACPVTNADIGMELFAKNTLALEQGSNGMDLTTVTSLRWNPIDSDVVACALSLGGPFGALAGGLGLGLGGAIEGAVIGMALMTTIGGIFADFMTPPDQEPDEGCEVTAADEDHVVTTCRHPLDLGEPLSLRLVPETLAGFSTGLVIRGKIEIGGTPNLVITATPLEWSQDLNCNTKSVVVSLTGGATFVDSSLARLATCEPEVVGDPLGFFSATWVEFGVFAIQLNEDVADQYYSLATRYPCKIIVRTNLGARGLDFGTLDRPLGPQDFGDITHELAKHCFKAHSDFWHSHVNFDWIVDPPWDAAVVEHVWDIVAAGLEPGDSVRVMHGAADVVAQARANERGAVRIRAVVSPSKATLSVGRVSSQGDGSVDQPFDPKRHVLGVTQTLLVARAHLRLAGRGIELASIRGSGRSQLVAVTDVGLEVWEPGGSQVLALRTRLRDVGLHGMVVRGSSVITYGKHGVRRFEPLEDRRLLAVQHASQADRPIMDALANEQPDVARRLAGTPSGRIEHATSDWFAETVRLGPWLARLGADRQRVVLYSVGRRTRVRIPFARR